MQKDDSIRLHHMLDAAKEAELFSRDKTRKSLDTDRELVLALVKPLAKYHCHEQHTHPRLFRSFISTPEKISEG